MEQMIQKVNDANLKMILVVMDEKLGILQSAVDRLEESAKEIERNLSDLRAGNKAGGKGGMSVG